MAVKTDFPDNIANFRKLKGLSPKRRVYAGIDSALEDMPDDDLSQTRGELPPMPEAPMQDPNNFDVRANQVIPEDEGMSEEGGEQENPLYRLGKALGDIKKGHPDNLKDFLESWNPAQKSPSESEESTQTPRTPDWSKLIQSQRELNPDWNPTPEIAEQVPDDISGVMNQEPQEREIPLSPEASQGMPSPEDIYGLQNQQPEIPQGEEISQEQAQEQKEPGTFVEMGAVDQAVTDPETQAELERIFGKITPEMAQQAADSEKAIDAILKGLSDTEANLSKSAQEIRTRIENRDFTTGQKIAMAIALLAPVIAGGIIGGKEGLLGGLGGGAGAMANAIQGREKELRADEASLRDLSEVQAKIGTQRIDTMAKGQEMKQKLMDSVGNKKLKEVLQNNLGYVKNDEGKDVLVIDTGDPMIPLKTSAIRDEIDYGTFKKKTLPALKIKLSLTNQANKLIEEMYEMVTIAKNQSLPGWTGSGVVKGALPIARDTMIDPETGKSVRISERFETKREQLAIAYSQALGEVGAKQAPATQREHFMKIMPNPFSFKGSVMGSGNLNTVQTQLRDVQKKMEDSLFETLKVQGVETAPIKNYLSSGSLNKRSKEFQRKSSRAEEAANLVLASEE